MMRYVLALLVALAFALPVGVAGAASPDPEARVVELVNQLRLEAGLAPVKPSDQLALSARRYSDYMASARFFGHSGPDGSTLVSRDEAAGYAGWTFLAENLAAGQATPEQAIEGWLNSPSHRANLYSPDVREIGVGYVYRPGSPYVYYWTQEFGTRAGTPPAAAVAAATDPRPQAAPAAVLGATAGAPQEPPAELRDEHASLETLGQPLGGVVLDRASGLWVQYYQRAVLEWQPANPARVQRRLLGDLLFPGADAPLTSADAPSGPSEFFPLSPDRPTGLGHFVADYTRDGQPLYFKAFFDANGGAQTFGYPKEEPKVRDGIWTQRFQAAVLEYHPEFDRDGFLPNTTVPYRAYRVQSALLGEQAFARGGSPGR